MSVECVGDLFRITVATCFFDSVASTEGPIRRGPDNRNFLDRDGDGRLVNDLLFHFLRCIRIVILVAIITSTSPATWAIEGSPVDGSLGVWSPLLPRVLDANGDSDSGDSVGTILELSGHHRFDGFLTSVEAGVEYGVTDSTEMFAYEFLIRDTWSWSYEIGELSAGTGFSQMQWEQNWGHRTISSDYTGAKIVAGWETTFGRQPIWIDLTLGLYDFDGTYRDASDNEKISTFTTTWGIDFKADYERFGIPMRFVVGVDYLRDMTHWDGGKIGTEEGGALTGAIEFRLF